MLGSAGTWPDDGEIDIMEQVGQEPNMIYGTIHNLSTQGTYGKGGSLEVEDPCSVYHIYHVTWTSSAITFGVDGTNYFTYENSGEEDYSQWPFDE